MKEDRRAARAREIEDAAYAVLDDKGYAGLTMLAVAKQAKASNETLYRWYGDKIGLFDALIRRNAAIVAEAINSAPDATPLDTLHRVGPILLSMLLGPRAIALNRAAAADATGALGRALASSGREEVAPRIAQIFGRAVDEGHCAAADPVEIAETYLSLLIGDLQVRRVIGALPEPGPDWIATRADRAVARTIALFPPPELDGGGLAS